MDLYVSVSRVDEFRRVVRTEWASEAMLINSIKAPTPLGWQARYGEALHGCIQEPERWRTQDGYMYIGRDAVAYEWPAAIVDACIAAWPKGCVFERRAQRDYYVDGNRVTVAGRIDAAHGLGVIEGKTKFGAVYPDDFVDSLQWRFYLDMLPWSRYVEYRLHEIGGMYSPPGTTELRIAKGGPRLEEIHEFRMWRQAGLTDELRDWIGEFMAWSASRGLMEKLRRFERAA